MDAREVMRGHMRRLADYRREILSHPPLRHLFLELTLRCNEHCLHCGSRCGEGETPPELTLAQYRTLLDEVRDDFAGALPQLNITGGEPLLRRDFFDIMAYARSLGFRWGMTSNGLLIDGGAAHRLKECGMKTISVSLDGTEETHDRLRGRAGAFSGALRGLEALAAEGFQHVQVTTVVNHVNIGQLPALFDLLRGMEVDSWRVIHIEPIGRAREHPELMLTGAEYRQVLDYIREKRAQGYPVTYGCSHYLGLSYERQVRDWYFLCNAGIYTASVTASGDIVACLDIERRPELTQGNVLRDRLRDIWEHRFEVFRSDLSDRSETCRQCDACEFCHGGAHHSWDYDRNEQQVCFKGLLF